jgi:hypothetical protein
MIDAVTLSMVEAKVIIQERLRELEEELKAHEENDFLSRELIAADIEKTMHLLGEEGRE